MRIRKLRLRYAVILATIVLALTIVKFTFGENAAAETQSNLLSPVWTFLFLTFAGAFGGLLYTLRDKGFERPHWEGNNYILGGLADCAYGIGGAYVVFLVIPGDFFKLTTVFEVIKIFGAAIVGGYGGRGLVDRVLADFLKKAEQVEKTVSEVKEKVETTEKLNEKALDLVDRQLDFVSPRVPPEELKEAIKNASSSTRAEIYKQVRRLRAENAKDNKQIMELSIPVFEALIALDTKEEFHQAHGQLGFALMDHSDPRWKEAEAELSKAIEIRDKGGEGKNFGFYDWKRAICRINLDDDFQNERPSQPAVRKEILDDLKRGAEAKDTIKAIGDIPPISEWIKRNKIPPEEISRPS